MRVTPAQRLAMFGRLLCFVLFGLAVGMAVATLQGCGILTDVMRAAGVPVSAGASEAARAVDAALFGWVDQLLWGAIGIAGSESVRATHRTVKRRRAKKSATQQGNETQP